MNNANERNARLIEEIANQVVDTIGELMNRPQFRRRATSNDIVYRAYAEMVAAVIQFRERTLAILRQAPPGGNPNEVQHQDELAAMSEEEGEV